MNSTSFRAPNGWWLVMLLAPCGVSCSSGEQLNPVHGKVVHKNQPLGGALVTFHPKGQNDLKAIPSVGLTKPDGTFSVTTGKKEGMPAGEYVVTIICSREVPTGKKQISTSGPETEDILQGAYSNRDSSKIVVTVKNGENELQAFDLK